MTDRADAIKILEDYKLFDSGGMGIKEIDEYKKYNEALDLAIEILEQEPSMAEGEWIKEINDKGESIGSWHCSNCYDSTGFYTTRTSDFCPKCGKRMKRITGRTDNE